MALSRQEVVFLTPAKLLNPQIKFRTVKCQSEMWLGVMAGGDRDN